MTYMAHLTTLDELRTRIIAEVQYSLTQTIGYSAVTDSGIQAATEDATELVDRLLAQAQRPIITVDWPR